MTCYVAVLAVCISLWLQHACHALNADKPQHTSVHSNASALCRISIQSSPPPQSPGNEPGVLCHMLAAQTELLECTACELHIVKYTLL